MVEIITYACVISDTHEGTDRPTFGNVTLFAELDSEEAGHTGRTIKQIPVDTGVDFDPTVRQLL